MTHLQVRVLNRAPMTITCLRVRLQISKNSEQSGKAGILTETSWGTAGVIPDDVMSMDGRKALQADQQPALELKPGEEALVPFSHSVRDGWSFSTRTATMWIMVYPMDVFFKDGARWLAASGYVRPNPDSPGTWNPISNDPKWTPWSTPGK